MYSIYKSRRFRGGCDQSGLQTRRREFRKVLMPMGDNPNVSFFNGIKSANVKEVTGKERACVQQEKSVYRVNLQTWPEKAK